MSISLNKSGLFLYIAHPDLFFLAAEEVTPFFKQLTKEVIDAAIKYDAVLEVNIHGLLRDRNRDGKIYLDYPCEYFWKEVAKTNIKVVHGGDFHHPSEIGNKKITDMFDGLVNKCQIKFSNIEEIYSDYSKRIKNI